MIDVELPKSLLEYTATYGMKNLVKSTSRKPGTELMQVTGMIGQLGLTWLFGLPMPKGGGFDGGYDIALPGRDNLPVLVDVKTMRRRAPVEERYMHNFVAAQRNLAAEAFVFCSWNWTSHVLTVCGWLPKRHLLNVGEFHKAGEIRLNDIGGFVNRYDNYEVLQRNLYPARSIFELQDDITRMVSWMRSGVEVG